VAPGANYGENCAIFEAIHGTAPDIAGKGIANPSAMLLSGCLLLEHLGFPEEATRIRKALEIIASKYGKEITPDLGGEGTTESFAQAIVRELKKSS
jgi:isocitrate dehydrogenase (NAD+)